MSNETIYYGHAGMLLSMLGNFVASSRMRDILLCGGKNVNWKKKKKKKKEATDKSLDLWRIWRKTDIFFFYNTLFLLFFNLF